MNYSSLSLWYVGNGESPRMERFIGGQLKFWPITKYSHFLLLVILLFFLFPVCFKFL